MRSVEWLGMSNGSLATFLSALLLAGCAMGDWQDDDVGEVNEASLCKTCGMNGLRKRAANYMPGRLNLGVLKSYGAATTAITPLCGSTFNSNGVCTLRSGWDAWLMSDTSNTGWEILTYLVKTVAPSHLGVRASNGVVYRGEVGLAPSALTQWWGAKEEQIATAGAVAYLNLNTGVEICFRTEDSPTACSGADGWGYEELYTFGNVFRGTTSTNVHWYVAGGKKGAGLYWSPAANMRVCGTDASVTCEVGLNAYKSADAHCDFGGNGNIGTRVARSCWSSSGVSFADPVGVFLRAVPAMLSESNPRPVEQIEL
jgi:hypothetical protein